MQAKNEKYRNLVMAAAAVLLTGLCFISVLISGEKEEEAVHGSAEAVMVSAGNKIEEFIVERAQLRDEEISMLSVLVEDASAKEEIRLAAQRRIMDIYTRAEQEMNIEGILRARGFDEVLATVGADCANILVRTDALSQADANGILELVCRETGLIGGNIKIIPLN